MATLVSPGVAVDVIDESFYIPGRQATIPLVFIATADEKTQPDGVTPALGTYESNVVRLVTSRSQLAELYGTPRFLTSSAGEPQHGDARNEYGLDALDKYLQIGNVAYVVRANVNLDDSYTNIKALWGEKVADAADVLNTLVTDFIQEYNDANGLFSTSDPLYKTTVTGDELKTLVDEAMVDVFANYSFSSTDFQNYFIMDNQTPQAGYQEVSFDDTGGNIIATDVTGLNNDTTLYGFEVDVTDNGGSNTIQVSVVGSDVQTFGDLASELELAIQTVTADPGTVVEIISGKLRITSGLSGATSEVDIVNDGYSGVNPLFSNVNLFTEIDDPVAGTGVFSLDIYNDTFTTVIGDYYGLDNVIDNWVGGVFTPSEAEGVLLTAAGDFDNTQEFRSETSLGANDAARRAAIVATLQGAVNNPTSLIRSERYNYNLVLAPGYWEVTDELVSLAVELDGEVFVIADTPFNRPPTGPNGIVDWADDNKVFNSLAAYYYPHGITSNTDGATIMTSAASSALYIYAVNDRDGELWFAPAGPARGTAPFINSIGYVSGTLGTATTFVENDIDQGTRDTLFGLDINYFTDLPDRGIVVLSQNTTQSTSTALDRVNVSRLVAYIRRELRRRLFDYLFEPNDTLTRQNVKAATDSFLGELISRRGLFDFATEVSESNNTPASIDRSELHVDIAIKPTKAVEFILVDLRVVRTDAEIR